MGRLGRSYRLTHVGLEKPIEISKDYFDLLHKNKRFVINAPHYNRNAEVVAKKSEFEKLLKIKDFDKVAQSAFIESCL